MITKEDLFRIRNKYLLETGRVPDEGVAAYADWLEVQLVYKAPEDVSGECQHPFDKVISAGRLHHCCKCKTNLK